MSCIAGVDAEVLATAQRESDAFGDLLLLDCEEGYGRGRVQMFAMRIGSKVVGGIWVKHILSVILILGATLPNLKLLSSDPMKRSHSIFLQASLVKKVLAALKTFVLQTGQPKLFMKARTLHWLILAAASFCVPIDDQAMWFLHRFTPGGGWWFLRCMELAVSEDYKCGSTLGIWSTWACQTWWIARTGGLTTQRPGCCIPPTSFSPTWWEIHICWHMF